LYSLHLSIQITPAFVREAYTLLRQSIIHVEHDAIDFDEEEPEGERGNDRPGPANNSEDVPMPAADMASTDESFPSVRVNVGERSAPAAADGSSSRAGTVAPMSDVPPPPALSKRRMVITHDKYVELQTMIVLHLAGHEQSTGKGMDREELIDWYLEQRESEMHDIDELEYEKELIFKLLGRLVKVCLVRSSAIGTNSEANDVLIRKIIYLKFGEMCKNRCHQWTKKA